MARKEMKGVRSVVEWFNADNVKSGAGNIDGLLINLSTGGRTAIYAAGLDPAVVGHVNKDTVFIHDVVFKNPSDHSEGMQAKNLVVDRIEAGLTDATVNKFPKKDKKNSGEKNNDESTEERWKFEVFGTPIGGDTGNEWQLAFELEKNARPQSSEMKFALAEHGVRSESLTITANGCVEKNITVEDNTYLRAAVDSTLSFSAIPIAGPEKTQTVDPDAETQWGNWFFLLCSVIMVVSFMLGIIGAYNEMNTPLVPAASDQIQSLSDNSNGAVRKPLLLGKSNVHSAPAEKSTTSMLSSVWSLLLSWTPFGSWWMWSFWLIVWIILIPVCFIDDVWEALVRTYQRSIMGIEAWKHQRKPFHYSVEVVRKSGKTIGQPKYSYNGSEIGVPHTKDQALNSVKGMSISEMKQFFVKYDFLTDLGAILLDRIVLSKIFGGSR